ncbi:MAG: AAA domain-containing protein [Thermoanaerobaculia bacterium]
MLDIAATFMRPWSLDWHYRSHDERLIAFSNHHIYGDRLITFPGARNDQPPLTHVFVEQEPNRDGDEESVAAEVRAVVDLILRHAAQNPSASLGVITMGIRHAQRIQAALDAVLRDRREYDEFFALDRRERFFIKNLERVQGDERDAIILSIGYGKDRGGNLRHHFGPLLYGGGERRLNVAITRARTQMTVVSSFRAADVDPSRAKGKGVELLRAYLTYAESGGAVLSDGSATVEPLNPFEADVWDALSARGIPMEAQWGVAGYRIDLAAKHPTRGGRFVLAIECDGASYHSAPTARDRDRLRQRQLEALGWRFHRIWSTDWFQTREQEIERAVGAYHAAVNYVDQHDARGRWDEPVRTAPESSSGETSRGRRVPRPLLPVVGDITQYTDEQLDRVLLHIRSDDLLRTDDELMAMAARELGFQRVGNRIRERLNTAIARTRGTG